MMMESSINSATILPPYEEEFEPVDNLHWSPETANSIYLFWIHQLQASNCSTYPNVTDANFDKDCNGNVVITCSKGFQMEQGLECVEEEWSYQNPICKRTECSYKYSNETDVHPIEIDYEMASDQAQCDDNCKFTAGCAVSFFDPDSYCHLYTAPLIFMSYNTDLNQCIEKCKERSDCVTVSSRISDTQSCYLLNVTQAEIPGDWKGDNSMGKCTVVEKIC
ncbi:hypothetical protein LOTGIDRAFT_160001 [Lottia gigantea]|uniref:Apple domain-containing protein n=1 Tax=Lottia gigantea TaxID=225164 RepID=V3ZWW8_LOTGI|nr:hypothetical protein LOTGIDRAFT_160001 [Lottia gigantea]ESO96018.1 hypothetical protein LOTGIDRAFT_160001 [Lottia gigantea]